MTLNVNILYDGNGNSLAWDGKNILLELRGQKKRRNIGWFESDGEGGVFHTNRDEVHKFRAMQGFGFNWHLFKNALDKKKFHSVVVHCGGKTYRARVEDVMRDGKTLKFSKQGFELQIFYPVERFEVLS